MENGEVVKLRRWGIFSASLKKKMTVDFIDTASNRDRVLDFINDERNIYNMKQRMS